MSESLGAPPPQAELVSPNQTWTSLCTYMVIARWSSLLGRDSKISDLFVPDTGLYKLQLRLEGVEHQGVGQLAACDKSTYVLCLIM